MVKAATFVDRMLRDMGPSARPVERPTTCETILNLRTASAIGREIPPSLPARADEVNE